MPASPAPHPWTYAWDSAAGYDGMTGAFEIKDATGALVCVINPGDFGKAEDPVATAEQVARQIVTSAKQVADVIPPEVLRDLEVGRIVRAAEKQIQTTLLTLNNEHGLNIVGLDIPLDHHDLPVAIRVRDRLRDSPDNEGQNGQLLSDDALAYVARMMGVPVEELPDGLKVASNETIRKRLEQRGAEWASKDGRKGGPPPPPHKDFGPRWLHLLHKAHLFAADQAKAHFTPGDTWETASDEAMAWEQIAFMLGTALDQQFFDKDISDRRGVQEGLLIQADETLATVHDVITALIAAGATTPLDTDAQARASALLEMVKTTRRSLAF